MDNRQHIDLKQDTCQNMTLPDLEHIASCDYCAEQFADYVEQQELLTAPKHMQDSIMTRSKQLDIQVIAKSNRASKKLQLFYYSLKVGFATAFALGMLFSMSPISGFSDTVYMPPAPRESYDTRNAWYDKANQFTNKLNDFKNQLFELEESFYDKQEK